MKWFRSYHGMCDDPKLTAVAMTAGVHHCFAVAAWQAVLEHASMQDDRGSIAGLDAMTLAIRIRIELPQATAIIAAMRHIGMIDDARVIAWVKRQKASDDGAKRLAEWRKRPGNGKKPAKTDNERNGGSEQESETVTLQAALSNVTFAQSLKESLSTNVDNSPPIVPQPEPVSPSAQSAVADVFLDPEPQLELMVPTEAEISIASVPAVYDATPSLPAKRHVYSAEFERFWAIYPRKKSKGFAEKAWKNAIKTIGSDELIAKLQERVPVLMMKPMYIPHPASWLNARGWEDEITQYDLMPQERTGTIGAVAYLMQNGKTDAFSDEINGMSERERELLSLPAWQNAIEGPAHRDDDGERCGDDRGPGRGDGAVHTGGGAGDVHRVGSSEQVVAEPVGAFGVGAGLRREAGPQGKSGAQIYAFRAA